MDLMIRLVIYFRTTPTTVKLLTIYDNDVYLVIVHVT